MNTNKSNFAKATMICCESGDECVHPITGRSFYIIRTCEGMPPLPRVGSLDTRAYGTIGNQSALTPVGIRVGTIHDSLNRFSIQNPLFWVNCESAIPFFQRMIHLKPTFLENYVIFSHKMHVYLACLPNFCLFYYPINYKMMIKKNRFNESWFFF